MRLGRAARRVGQVGALAVATAVAAAACGGDDATLTGYERTPAPEVAGIVLPNLTDDGDDFALRADPGELLLVYFGYTNCPDYCPTTMSDVRLARDELDDELDARIDIAMITIDPDRDLDVLAEYVTGFMADGIALGTADAGELAAAAAPFGAAYSVEEAEDGGEPSVGHSTSLYAVDDNGTLVLTWPFGVEIEQLATDFEILLDRMDDA